MAGGGNGGGSFSCGSASSVAGGGTVGGDIEAVPVWGDVRSSSRYMEEIFRRGEPEMRPYVARLVLPRTTGMASRANQYRGHALFADTRCSLPSWATECG